MFGLKKERSQSAQANVQIVGLAFLKVEYIPFFYVGSSVETENILCVRRTSETESP